MLVIPMRMAADAWVMDSDGMKKRGDASEWCEERVDLVPLFIADLVGSTFASKG